MRRGSLVTAHLGGTSIGGSQAFVYVIVAGSGAAAYFYVGQTRQRMGALGRIAEHLSEGDNATFRKRLLKVAQVELDGPVQFAVVELSAERAFQGECADYREAVECLIESRLREFVVARGIPALSVARVKLHAYRTSSLAIREASRSGDELERWLESAVSQLASSA